MKVWLTRYALTQGIQQVEGTTMGVPSLFHVPHKRTYERPDWHESYTDAVRRAEEMRIERIIRLKRQIKKLEKLSFLKGNEHDADSEWVNDNRIIRGNDDDEADSSGC